ncbi:MAG: group II intron maturase-specific domain-containing protein [Planctomycetota bacterium]
MTSSIRTRRTESGQLNRRKLRPDGRGWMGCYGVASQLKLFALLDGWIRRRIRCCYWKRWRRSKTRRRNLIALGVPRR